VAGGVSWLVNLPGRLTKLGVDLVTLKGLMINPLSGSGMPTSIDKMNPTNPFIKTSSSIPIADKVTKHSIEAAIGLKSNIPARRLSDTA
jgi:hypothetical protein